MRLLHLHIENFGVLQDFDLDPAEGLNVLYQKNGWGKSTLAVFIKAMLYGLPANTKRSLDENERKKYTPWQGGAFGGSIEFSCEKGSFRAERFFAAKEANDSFALYDLSTNKPSSAFGENLGEELFGIDADGFERSTYLSQRMLMGGRENASITAKLGDLLDDVGDIGGYEAAMEALDKRRGYYVKTGNRGFIADTEQELTELNTELERCMRVEEALRGRTEELRACTSELERQTKIIDRTRADMQKAGLGRERAAHNEQKNSMLDRLRGMTAARDRINDFFRNAPPSSAELNEGRRLYEEIKEADARLNAIPDAIPESEELALLRRRYPKGIPAAQTIARIEADNNELISLCAQKQALTENAEDAGILRRFPNGAPDTTEIEEACKSVAEAARLQRATESARQKHAELPRSTRPAIGAGLSGIGILAVVLSLLPALKALLLPLLIIGLLAAASGAVMIGTGLSFNSKQKKLREARESEIGKREQEAERLLSGVGEMLLAYGIAPASHREVPRELDHFAGLVERYREAMRQKRRCEDSIQTLTNRIGELSARLSGCFRAIYGELGYREDYREALDKMKADLNKLAYLENADRVRMEEQTRAAAILDAKREALLPFLRRFDPVGKMRAGECLNHVSEQSAEFVRLEQEIRKLKNELSGFIVEKKLDSDEGLPDPGAYERLAETEARVQEQINELRNRQNRLLGDCERMAQETERIPELLDAVKSGRERLNEARANASTITNTAKLLEEAKIALSTRYLGGMQESFHKALSELVPKNTPEAVMDTSFEVRLREGGQTRGMDSFSRGWRDAVEFCTRLSLTDALFANSEKPPILLDDPFVNLDDERMTAAHAMLERLSEKYQILYLVCHKDRI